MFLCYVFKLNSKRNSSRSLAPISCQLMPPTILLSTQGWIYLLSLWGTGGAMVRFVAHFLIRTLTPFLLHRHSCRLDDNHKWYRSDNTILFKNCKSPQPRDHTHDCDEQLWLSTTECDHGCISGLHGAPLLVARALHDVDALPNRRVPKTLGTRPWMGENVWSIEIWILVGWDAKWSGSSSELLRYSQDKLQGNIAWSFKRATQICLLSHKISYHMGDQQDRSNLLLI